MIQPVSLGLADALRCQFFNYLPPERIERLFSLPKTINTVNGLHFAKPIIAILRTGFSIHFSSGEQEKILQFILDKLTEVKPEDEQSPAHLAWEWRWQRVNLELNPDKALQRLAELAGENSPLKESIQVELENTTLPQPNDKKPSFLRKLNFFSTKPHVTTVFPKFIPLRVKPKSAIALQRFQRIAKDSGIKKLSFLPVGTTNWVIISLLISILFGISYLSG